MVLIRLQLKTIIYYYGFNKVAIKNYYLLLLVSEILD